ncbi:MAG: phage portal protein [Proteobacteria bacterium]|nr:phage portal protein [Pseudomonadota bacterium]
MWPFRPKAAPQRTTPTPPYIDGAAWALGPGQGGISPQTAQAIAAVLACIQLVSETIASLPASVMMSDDSRKAVGDHPLSRLIVTGCNPNQSWSDLMTDWIASTLLHGNGAVELATDARGQLVSLTTIPWTTVTPFAGPDGSLQLDVIETLPPRAGKRRTLLRDDFVLLKDRGDNALLGVSRLQRAGTAIQLALTTQVAAYQFGVNQARPAGVLTAPGKISKETAERLAVEWDGNYAGSRRGKTAVLPEGLEWKPLSLLSAEDQQIVERLRYSVEDVSRLFGVPLFLLGDPNRATYASAAAATGAFQRSLLPWVAKIERAFRQTVLDPRYRLAIDVGAMLRSDPETMASAIAKLRTGGVISPNDAREMLGLAASDDALANAIAPPNTSTNAIPSVAAEVQAEVDK